MVNEPNSPEVKEIQSKPSEIKRNLSIFSSKFGLVSLVAWYRHKRDPHQEINLFEIKEEIDRNLFGWTVDLVSWFGRTSVSGLILWYLMFMLFIKGPPFHLFFAFGLVWWIFMRFIRDVKEQLRR